MLYIETKIKQLEKDARSVKSKWVATWPERERNEDKAACLTTIAETLGRLWDKGRRDIMPEEYDRIVRQATELSFTRRTARHLERKLAAENARTAVIVDYLRGKADGLAEANLICRAHGGKTPPKSES